MPTRRHILNNGDIYLPFFAKRMSTFIRRCSVIFISYLRPIFRLPRYAGMQPRDAAAGDDGVACALTLRRPVRRGDV